jgi:hypothetical protein
VSADLVQLKPRADGLAREAFIQQVAQSFDAYVESYGHEPEALVMVWGGVKLTARTAWLCRGNTEGASVTMLSLAQAALMKEIVNPD